jgi:hypothetical protein
MKTMKRIMTFLLSLALAMPMMAQSRYHIRYPSRPTAPSHAYNRPYERNTWRTGVHGDTYYGLRVGLALSSVSSDDAYLDGSGLSTGVNIGVVAGFQLAPSAPIYFETGLSYTEKGGRGHYNGNKFTYDLDYLEVPLLLKYDYWTSPDLSVQPFIGGYLACGVGGKVKDFGHRQAVSSFDDEFFKRFDGGLRIGCGLQFSHLYAEVAYDIGLSNICHDSFNSSRNGCLQLNCGVNF